jgi:UDP-N-acetylmuramate--alanine ligase
MTLGKVLNLDIEKIKTGLKNFKGTWRRQEYKGKILESGFENFFYDDYAHHPTEIRATINAFREKFPNHKMIVSFMPHLFSRTKILFSDFVQVLNMNDEIILSPIDKARETDDGTIKSEMLSHEINKISQKEKSTTVENMEELRDKILEKVKEQGNKVFIIMGAGNISEVCDMLNLEK